MPSVTDPERPRASLSAAVFAVPQPHEGNCWLHEVTHDAIGSPLVAIISGHGGLKLISRRGYDRPPLSRPSFLDLLPLDREILLDGEITYSTIAASPHRRPVRRSARKPIDTYATFAECRPQACYTFFTRSSTEGFRWLL